VHADNIGPIEDLHDYLQLFLLWTWDSLDLELWGSVDAHVAQRSLQSTGGDQNLIPQGLKLIDIAVCLIVLRVTQGSVQPIVVIVLIIVIVILIVVVVIIVIVVIVVDVVVVVLIILRHLVHFYWCFLRFLSLECHGLDLIGLLLLRNVMWRIVMWLLLRWHILGCQLTD
jgi:hypothetical protein